MNEQPTMLSTVHYVRDLHEQSALLLRTADTILHERSFTDWSGNMCIWESGQTHIEPFKWMPSEVVRFYTSERYDRVLFFVSIIFWDRYREYKTSLSECLLTAGITIFNTQDWGDSDWQRNWWGRWHGYPESRRDDGSLIDHVAATWEDSENYPKLDRIVTLGRPLSDVTTADVLKTTLKPLFERVEQTIL